MGNGCCSAYYASDTAIAMDLTYLEEMVSDLAHLDNLILIIDQRLRAITAKNDRAQQNTGTQEASSSSTFGCCKNFGKDLMMNISKHEERNRCTVCFKSAYSRDTRKVVFEVLKSATQIQSLGAGVCVVGYLLDQIEQVSSNREQCVQMLRVLCALARRVKQLDDRVPAERENLEKAVDFIFHGCFLCLTQMESPGLCRIFQALADARNLQNLESRIQNTYADLTVGAVIQNTPYYPPPTQGHNLKPVGRVVATARIIKLLKMDPEDRSKRAVVLYGVGGIGKTTLASAVYGTLIGLQGYTFCRLFMDHNISDSGIRKLQQQMLRELFGQGNVKLNDYQHGWEQLREAFKWEHEGKLRIFLFIDNALEADNLAKLLPTDLSCLPDGMRILVTTRKLDETEKLSLADLKRIPFEVDVLTHSDSKKLLFKIALGNANASLPPAIDSADVDEIVNMCGGIPLILELVGPKFKECLSGSSNFKSLKDFLKDFLAGGREEIERVVDEVYKRLGEASKEAFLDIVCFFDKYSQEVVSAAVGKGRLNDLEQAGLIKLSFGDQEKCWSLLWGTKEDTPQSVLDRRIVRVHDIIKERGRWLSRQTRILEVESLKDALQERRKVKGIQISHSEDTDIFKLKEESLDITHSCLRILRILKLPKSVEVEGICRENFKSLSYMEVARSLPVPPKQLEGLTALKMTDGEKIDEASAFFPPNKLYISIFTNYFYLVHLFPFCIIGNNVQLPASLQLLFSEDSANLEYLSLEGCDEVTRVPKSLGLLKFLTLLSLSRCRNLTSLPENIESLSALKWLILSDCTKLPSLPPTIVLLESLLTLNMNKCIELTFLPDNFGNLSSLQQLSLNGCEKLVELPENFGALSALELLSLSGCSNLQRLPESFGQLKSLKQLSINRCQNLKMLSNGFRYLTSLMTLNASACKSLGEEEVDILVEIESLLVLNMAESGSLIQRWQQIGHSYPLIVYDPEVSMNDKLGRRAESRRLEERWNHETKFFIGRFMKKKDALRHTVEYTLFHGESRFVGVESDGEQLVDWFWSSFEGEEEVDVSVLLTMCDLSLDCNKSVLKIVKKEMERKMEESLSGGRKFQTVYVEVGDSVEKSEVYWSDSPKAYTQPHLCLHACQQKNKPTVRIFSL